MQNHRRPLIIPVEEQSRELDAKLLLAAVAAERGFPVIVGSRHEIHLQAARLPAGIYYAKSFRPISLRMFDILCGLGFEIVACDEEGLLPYPDEIYFERRVSPQTLARISNLFAWGPDDAARFRRYPDFDGTAIHVTGNPRADLLRPELRAWYTDDVKRLRDRFGDFVLINTNFGAVNHRVSSLVLENQTQTQKPDADSYQALITRHKAELFSHFKAIVPKIGRALPDVSIVVRPHPVENNQPWMDAAAGCSNVHVVHEGNVIPWLLAAKVLVQNNCTTAVEAAVLGQPVINYQPVRSERLDEPFCTSLSHCRFDFESLSDTLRDILEDRLGALDGPEQRKLLGSRFAGIDGPLASDRIVDVMERIESEHSHSRADRGAYKSAWRSAYLRSVGKQIRSCLPWDKNHRGYQDHRFPRLAVAEVQSRIDRLRATLGRFEGLRVEPLGRNIFKITAAGT
jgi:surface carbohydrate biosynthesis protein